MKKSAKKKPAKKKAANVHIGSMIKSRRSNFRLSQEELCFGICTASNLSKIENGQLLPTRGTFEALMERLGMNHEMYPSYLSNVDEAIYNLQHDFNEHYSCGNLTEACETLAKLDAIRELDMTHEHFVRLSKLLVESKKGMAIDKQLKEYANAIKLFAKDFSLEKIRFGCFTKTELNVINAFALRLHKSGDENMPIKVLYELLKWIDNHTDDIDLYVVVYTKLLYNLSTFVGRIGDDAEVLKLCDTGIELCLRYGKYKYLAGLLFNKGYVLVNTGRIDEAHVCIRQCYYLESAGGEGSKDDLKFTRDFAQKIGLTLE